MSDCPVPIAVWFAGTRAGLFLAHPLGEWASEQSVLESWSLPRLMERLSEEGGDKDKEIF